MIEASAPGFFGKLPCNGDFLQRRVAAEFVSGWDDWLQRGVAASRAAMGEAWLPAYLAAPLWRFVLAEGALGSAAYAGVMAASVDRVGRYFPITVVLQIDVAWNPLDLAVCWSQWFEEVETCLVEALEDGDLRLENFEARLLSVRDPATITTPAGLESELFRNLRFPSGAQQWLVGLPSLDHLQLDLVTLAYRELHRCLRPVTLWWTAGSSAIAPCWLAARGLPAEAGFRTLLDGTASDDSWRCANPAERSAQQRNLPSGEISRVAAAPPSAASVADTVVDTRIPTDRPSDVEGNLAAFVVRPEIGLWAVITPADGSPAEAARTVAAALQDVAPEGSLSALVEKLRATLQATSQHLVRQRAMSRADPGTADVIVLARVEGDCALLHAGGSQAMRIRGDEVATVIGHGGAPAPDPKGADLLSLVQGTDVALAPPCGSALLESVPASFERIFHGDEWLLCGRGVDAGTTADGIRAMVRPLADGRRPAAAMLLQVRAA